MAELYKSNNSDNFFGKFSVNQLVIIWERYDQKLPKFIKLPQWLVWTANVMPFLEKMRYGPEYVFVDLEDADMIYECMFLCVGKEARGKGLGTELIRRGYELAKKVYNLSLGVLNETEGSSCILFTFCVNNFHQAYEISFFS